MVNVEAKFSGDVGEPAGVHPVAAPEPDRRRDRKKRKREDAGTVLLAYLREQLDALTALDPLVRQGAPDSVHELRVATRRLRSALASYRSLLAQGSADRLRAELQWLACAVGAARDNEVMHERLDRVLAEEPKDLIAGPVGERIEEYFAVVQKDAQRVVQHTLDGERYVQLMADLRAYLADPPWTSLAAEPARAVLPGLVRKEWKRLRRAVRSARSIGAGATHDLALHEVRKRAKRLRYASEGIAPLRPKRYARIVDSARQVQDLLGDHHDSVVARDMLLRLGMQAFVGGDNAFTYGRLHATEQAGSSQLEVDFSRMWKRFPRPR